MKSDLIAWRLCTWFLESPQPPCTPDVLVGAYKAIQCKRKPYRLRWAGEHTVADIRGSFCAFLRHFQMQLGEFVPGLEWTFNIVVDRVCPECDEAVSFIYEPESYYEATCQCPKCDELISIKRLGFKQIKKWTFQQAVEANNELPTSALTSSAKKASQLVPVS